MDTDKWNEYERRLTERANQHPGHVCVMSYIMGAAALSNMMQQDQEKAFSDILERAKLQEELQREDHQRMLNTIKSEPSEAAAAFYKSMTTGTPIEPQETKTIEGITVTNTGNTRIHLGITKDKS